MTRKPYILFVHDGKAAYPAVPAYIRYFSEKYECRFSAIDEYAGAPDPHNAILWYMMGFYRNELPALIHIHDYRSLSIGRFASFKDKVKRYLNFTPDLRVFQNLAIKEHLNFRDGVPECIIPVGISPNIFDINIQKEAPKWDFAYVGAVNRERNMGGVIDSFLARFGSRRSLLLIGPTDESLLSRYKKYDNLFFVGKTPQLDAYNMLMQSKVCLAYFPYHRPHKFQAPTKLLEYIHLGRPILANDAPSNLEVLRTYSAKAVVRGKNVFENCPEPEEFEPNSPVINQDLLWPNFIEASGIGTMLDGLVAARSN